MDNKLLITFDVEDWFQVENFRNNIPFSSWSSRELRAENNVHRLLDLLDSIRVVEGGGSRIRTTFFVLGWLAERLPSLVREIHHRGHEVASHGFFHRLSSHQGPQAFKQDIIDSKKLLEDIIGAPVFGYRAPNFSVSIDVLRIIEDSGYFYDSSFNSFSMNSRYGQLDLSRNSKIGIALEVFTSFYEIPISNLTFGRIVLPWGGGGYFRLIPSHIFQEGVRYILRKQGAYLFFMHPWEIDSGQPKVNDASVLNRFRHYLNIPRAFSRLSSLLKNYGSASFVSCRGYLTDILGSNNAISNRNDRP